MPICKGKSTAVELIHTRLKKLFFGILSVNSLLVASPFAALGCFIFSLETWKVVEGHL